MGITPRYTYVRSRAIIQLDSVQKSKSINSQSFVRLEGPCRRNIRVIVRALKAVPSKLPSARACQKTRKNRGGAIADRAHKGFGPCRTERRVFARRVIVLKSARYTLCRRLPSYYVVPNDWFLTSVRFPVKPGRLTIQPTDNIVSA